MIEDIHPPIYSKDDFKGAWEEAAPEIQKRASHLMATCYVRDGNRNGQNHDGSMGTVKMTPRELMDFITFIISGEKRV